MYNAATIEAIYQLDIKRAEETYAALVEAAEKQRAEKLQHLEDIKTVRNGLDRLERECGS